MNIVINGIMREISETMTIAQLLNHFALDDERVAVEHNQNILTAEQWKQVFVQEGDQLEVVRFVGGG